MSRLKEKDIPRVTVLIIGPETDKDRQAFRVYAKGVDSSTIKEDVYRYTRLNMNVSIHEGCTLVED